MSDSEKDDGIPKFRIAGPKGYAFAAALITIILGDNLVDVVITTTHTDGDRDAVNQRIEDLEKTVYLMEHGLLNTKLMCTSNMRLVSHAEDEEEFFDQ